MWKFVNNGGEAYFNTTKGNVVKLVENNQQPWDTLSLDRFRRQTFRQSLGVT